MSARGSTKAPETALFAAVAAARAPTGTGRPKGADPRSERSREPWREAGVSQRTYYRRKAKDASTAAPPPVPLQHAAHVAAWFARLGPIGQLEHKAFVRRCLLGRGPA